MYAADMIQISPRLWSLVSLSALVCVVVAAKSWFHTLLRRLSGQKELPLLRVDGDGDIMQEGYDRYRDELHKIRTPEGKAFPSPILLPDRWPMCACLGSKPSLDSTSTNLQS